MEKSSEITAYIKHLETELAAKNDELERAAQYARSLEAALVSTKATKEVWRRAVIGDHSGATSADRAPLEAAAPDRSATSPQVDIPQFDFAPLAPGPGVRYVEIEPGAHFAPMPPSFVLGPFPEYLTRIYFGDVDALPLGCYYVEGAGITSHGLLIRNGRFLLNDQLLLSPGTVAIARLYGPVSATGPTSRFVEEPLACVIGPGYLTYGHWLVDFLPKLYLLHRVGIDPMRIKYLIPKDTPEFGFAWLRLVGISDSQLILFDPYAEVVGAKQLILPTLVRTNNRAHPLFPEAVEYLLSLIRRRHRIATSARGGRSLFISRADSGREQRKLLNREAIEQAAAEAGFEIYRPEAFSLRDQLEAFASAATIVGEYGSALHASIFAPPGTAVLALRANAILPGFLQSGLCQVMNQKVACLLGAAGKDDLDQEFSILEEDFKMGLRWLKDFSAIGASRHPKRVKLFSASAAGKLFSTIGARVTGCR